MAVLLAGNVALELSPRSLDADYVSRVTQRWFQRFVVDLRLCPFAQKIRPRILVSSGVTDEDLLAALSAEMAYLQANPALETTLLVHPDTLTDFLDYNDFLSLCDDLLRRSQLEGVFQIASFHPNYQFAGTRPDDAENYANRSPYPMLHILREDQVTIAVDSHPDVDGIPARNALVLGQIGSQSLSDSLAGCFDEQ